MIFNVVLERTGAVLGSFALVGKEIIGAPAAQKLVGDLLNNDVPAGEIARALDGYTNGYYVLRAVDFGAPGDQTAALYEFCTTPLHPGPCRGWKHTLPDDDPRKPRAKAAPAAPKGARKAAAAAKPVKPRAPAKTAPAKASPSPSEQELKAMGDDDLFDLFSRLSKEDTLDELLMQRLIADMDRRENNAKTPELTPEQKRVDDLVAGGRDFLSAYAEVHGKDENTLKAEQGRAAVERRTGETSANAVRRSYDEFTHINYLQAEKATRGNMLNKRGKADGIDPLTLFTGPISRARRYASEELMRWWSENARMNLTQFRAEVLGDAKDRAAAKKTRQLSNAKDFI